ncbi:MAG: dihydroorotate dehydrogenase electron transfer subunit [Oscillospiraceae bacterium]|nr:dihydroorotate dehydrogenase electron transfer subunit [Oscillospiraceae bacterium]
MLSEVLAVRSNEMLLPDIGRLTVEAAAPARPGQFYMLRPEHGAMLLGRAISLCDRQGEILTFLYKIVGKGTAELSRLREGDPLRLTGPLGNGFPLEDISGKIALIGGGVGVAPMVYTARALRERGNTADAFLGYPDSPYLHETMKTLCDKVTVATESGVCGAKGYVTDIFDPEKYAAVLCCGPLAMMRAVAEKCKAAGTPVWLSLENRMACGVGACLVCTCKGKSGGNLRVCADGPVFRGEEISLDA